MIVSLGIKALPIGYLFLLSSLSLSWLPCSWVTMFLLRKLQAATSPTEANSGLTWILFIPRFSVFQLGFKYPGVSSPYPRLNSEHLQAITLPTISYLKRPSSLCPSIPSPSLTSQSFLSQPLHLALSSMLSNRVRAPCYTSHTH